MMKDNKETQQVNLLGDDEQRRRLARVFALLESANLQRALISSNANIYYLTGRIFRGYVYIDARAGAPVYFVRKPSTLSGDGVIHIAKPADLYQYLPQTCIPLGLELDSMSWNDATRLSFLLNINVDPLYNVSPLLRQARAVKTDREQDLLRQSGLKQTAVYRHIPRLYQPGMSDIELQIEIERLSRRQGCLGIFRVGGSEMEIFMGNVLTGDNADTPSPYDFAMGGAGADPSLPVGADGSIIKPSQPVMVDMNGNYTGYMTDMTRCFIAGDIPAEVEKANTLSRDICRELAAMMIPGTPAADLYHRARAMAADAGMEHCFMGLREKAPFVGHGVGIEINELPVIAPRSRDIIQLGNAIALEPKFVFRHLGAVGVENTYLVGPEGGELITAAPQEVVQFA